MKRNTDTLSSARAARSTPMSWSDEAKPAMIEIAIGQGRLIVCQIGTDLKSLASGTVVEKAAQYFWEVDRFDAVRTRTRVIAGIVRNLAGEGVGAAKK